MFKEAILAMATKRVLIVDDEPDVRAVVQGCLEDIAGWDVVTAASGQEGLAKVMVDRPNAIVLDVMMPGMDGLTFLRELRTRPEGRSIPVVLLTAKINPADPKMLSELSINGIISKPFDPFKLTEQIADFLGWEMEQ
ncbi:response regulator [Aerosakkonemataceae cyanobacterium BLCC-F50]|uniref:Response regulator n=1 Tax=Floridaenema flaviceps BLCC-F50 TaxID=3153642 RepID=A0ABV4Y3F4_9CYAN